jgi:hypothetical protein
MNAGSIDHEGRTASRTLLRPLTSPRCSTRGAAAEEETAPARPPSPELETWFPTQPGSIPFQVRARIPPVTPGTLISPAGRTTRFARPRFCLGISSFEFTRFPVTSLVDCELSSTICVELEGLSPREATDPPLPAILGPL